MKPNQAVKVLDRDGKLVETGRISKVLAFRGLERRAGRRRPKPATSSPSPACRKATVAHTICDPEIETPIQAQPIDPPTLAMTFRVNDSPLAGTEGNKVTGRMIRDPPAARGRRQRRAARRAKPTTRIRWRSPAAANCSSAS